MIYLDGEIKGKLPGEDEDEPIGTVQSKKSSENDDDENED
jgi:hypothetical protein